MSDNRPLACDLSAIDDEERAFHKENGEQLFGSIEEIKELPDGYAFGLPAETATIERAGAFIARERLCCPFFHFTVEVTPDHGPVWLHLTGDEEVKQYIANNVVSQME
ncbi:hypothetical protein NC796_24585 [Aliifodinibius sp. S!AR15-10]|uniref:hypothetical protein n=1 Tax=Aliifodinibius sp. S!AR15-10 TaxID=2950437 RepID=UPI00285682AF|nr:hypothetical protein [Aliifodinibius sp. S!AR15-10]MDR8394349.1 hypothetical protein [Aliifodinibius sp. S!AR15-10]